MFFFSFSFAGQNLRIVEPFPENISAIEFSAAHVTCVAFDSTGELTPEKITFFRRNESGREHELTANERLYFTNRTQNNLGESAVTAIITLNVSNHHQSP